MAIFIPAILEQNKKEFMEILNKLTPLVSRIQIDFADSTLVANRTVLPDELGLLPTTVEFDAHLMVDQPTHYFADLKKLGFARAIVHKECQENFETILAAASHHQLGLALVLNPETKIDPSLADFHHLDFIQLMGVHPGFGGQPFIETTYDRIRQARILLPNLPIAIDGGVRLDNAQAIIEAGAEFLIVGRQGFEGGIEKWQNLL